VLLVELELKIGVHQIVCEQNEKDAVNGNGATRYVVALLLLAGGVAVGLRYRSRHDSRGGRDDAVWRLTYDIEGETARPGSKFHVAFPQDTQNCRVYRNDLRQSNLRTSPPERPGSETREVVAVVEKRGECRLTVRFDLQLNAASDRPVDSLAVVPQPQDLARYLASAGGIEVESAAIRDKAAEFGPESISPNTLATRVFEFCRSEIETDDDDAPITAAKALAEGEARPLGRARLMVALCRAAHLPARLMAGFEIRENPSRRPSVWVEVLLDEKWTPFDPTAGHARRMPYNYLPVRSDAADVVLNDNLEELETRYAIVRLPGPPQGMTWATRHPMDILDLTRLPLEMHEVLSLILLMPLGALVTCIFRNVIGIRTSGTFTPTLLALSFVFADWRTGLLVLSAVVVLGLITRNLLDRLKLLMLPRLSVMLTLVVLCLVFGISLLDYLNLTPGAHSVLLPMVILTMIVERFYVTTQEDGVQFALKLLAGTMLVGVCCYLLLRWETVAQLLFRYPELHCFTVASLVLIGRYTGYQLLEPWRFRDMIGGER